jgi:hypothetical protein
MLINERMFQRLMSKPQGFDGPYAAGFDAGKNGPNEDNSHYSWFSAPEATAEWERGKRAAENWDG